ncbi:hypothetical protein F4779DRAFT_191657 [Xylariaceae sp. FL0662B]|nr:hypothetical protein F4779DRAFT_191657 [Xylariaceae sp. FL0662B]
MNMHFPSQPSFAPVFGFTHGQGNTVQYTENQYPVHPGFPGFQYMYGYQQPRSQLMVDPNPLGDGKTESKPRLSKEEVDKLEKVFQENPKPSSSVKAQLADGLGLERPRINNWFQNRRAKAKQERKQEEYEARRQAEKTGSEPVSPDEDPSGREYFGESSQRPMQPSSAVFPDINSASQISDDSYDNQNPDDSSARSESFDSPYPQQHPSHREETSDDFQSPLSIDFSNTDLAGFSQTHPSQTYSHPRSMESYASFAPRRGIEHISQDGQPANLNDSLASPVEQNLQSEPSRHQYPNMMATEFPSPATGPFYETESSIHTHGLSKNPAEATSVHDDNVGNLTNENETTALCQGLPTPTDSFKSPPPPANIASRRNIPRPATLQAAALRSRSYNLGCGPKTALDGSKRIDPSSPASAIRRIASTTGNMHGRIQKSSAGPRSPMFFGRNPEALLQYHARSPVGPATATFSGAAPPTPMTPVVIDQQGIQEPTVSSTCSDDGSFLLGGVSASIMQELKTESNLKTPPSTPGLLTNFASHNYAGNFSSGVDFSSDQPLFTPYFQTEFSDLSIRNMPSYVELSDSSLPATPLYPNMVSSVQEQNTFAHNAVGNTQFDWDANESVTSSRSSPGQPRSKQIQFTQNMTPQDYTSHQEK